MSTRCQIGIYDFIKSSNKDYRNPSVLLYKHSDGYIEGTLPLLKRYVKRFLKNRGFWDTEYIGARLIQSLTNEYDRSGKKFAKEAGFKWRNDMCGFGICQNLHSDIEYYYALYPDRIDVYDTCGDWNDMKLIKSFSYSRRGLKGL